MIVINDRGRGFEKELRSLCADSPFGARIEAYYSAYKSNIYSFLDFWLCRSSNNKAVCALCRYYDTLIFCGECSEEVKSFIEMLSPRNVLCDNASGLSLPGYLAKTGETMRCIAPKALQDYLPNGFEIVLLNGEMDDLREVYTLLLNEYSDGASLGCFNDYFIDMSHRIRHKVTDVYTVRFEGRIVSTLAAVALSQTAAVIGSVATDSRFRRRGIAGYLVSKVTNDLCRSGKTIFLHRERYIGIYERAGYEVTGKVLELRKSGEDNAL